MSLKLRPNLSNRLNPVKPSDANTKTDTEVKPASRVNKTDRVITPVSPVTPAEILRQSTGSPVVVCWVLEKRELPVPNSVIPVQFSDAKSDVFMSRAPRPNWVYIREIGWYIPGEHVSIATEVFTEVDDPQFSRLTHGCPSTFNAGCRGPLCRKAQRDRLYTVRRNKDGAIAVRKSKVRDSDRLLDVIREYHYTQIETETKRRGLVGPFGLSNNSNHNSDNETAETTDKPTDKPTEQNTKLRKLFFTRSI